MKADASTKWEKIKKTVVVIDVATDNDGNKIERRRFM